MRRYIAVSYDVADTSEESLCERERTAQRQGTDHLHLTTFSPAMRCAGQTRARNPEAPDTSRDEVVHMQSTR